MNAGLRPFIGQVMHLASVAAGAATAILVGLPAEADEIVKRDNFVISDDGAYVVDLGARLAWSRCDEGMRWNGKACTGTPVAATYAWALTLVTERNEQEGSRWRLPRLTELKRLASRSGHSIGADPHWFPGAPGGWYWTSTTNVDTKPVNQYNYQNISNGVTSTNVNRLSYLHMWGVNLSDGESRGDISKRSKASLRLVQSIDPPGRQP